MIPVKGEIENRLENGWAVSDPFVGGFIRTEA
jgi:hypothetical protein